MSSTKQLEANKANATKSTGPKTEAGKEIVKYNAVKHGLLSEEVVIETDELGETREEYQELKESLIKDLKPVGTLEELLVDRVATCYWRLRRALRAENGEIVKQTNNLWFKRFTERAKEADQFEKFPTLYDFKYDRLRNSISAGRVKDSLAKLKEEVEKEGKLSEQQVKEYLKLTNLPENEESLSWFIFFNEIAEGKVSEEKPEKGKKALLFTLDKDLEAAKTAKDVVEAIEQADDEAETARLSVPTGEVAEKLSRYETSLENQLYKAMNQLLKLQTLRKGGRVISANIAELESIEN